MDAWDWQSFWNELAPPALAATVVLGILAMIARWAWNRHRPVVFWSALWLMMLAFIGFVFVVLQSNKAMESARPYFTKSQASIYAVVTDDGKKTSNTMLTVSVQNNDRPAKNITHQLLILDEQLDPTREPLRAQRTKTANDIGRHQILNRHTPVSVGPNTRSAFVVFEIQYTDASTDESYSQIWFMKFTGSKDGTFTPTLFESTQDERAKMEAYIRQRGIPMLSFADGVS